MPICINCGSSENRLKKVWRSRGDSGGMAETYICADSKKCVGSKAYTKEMVKKILEG